jgi:hypothetical protein
MTKEEKVTLQEGKATLEEVKCTVDKKKNIPRNELGRLEVNIRF